MPDQAWASNLFGATLSDDQIREIAHPRIELTVHVTYKTVEAFAILGACVFGPATALVRGPRTIANVAATAVRAAKIGALLGLPLGPVLTYARMKSLDDDAVYDRCYRLRYNRNQVRVDRSATVGAVAGGAGGAFLSGAFGSSVATGAVGGIGLGVLLAALFNFSR